MNSLNNEVLNRMPIQDLLNEITRRKRDLSKAQDDIELRWWTATKEEKIAVLQQMRRYSWQRLNDLMIQDIITATGSEVYGHDVDPADYDYVTSAPFAVIRDTIGPPFPKSKRGWAEEYADAIHVRWGLHEDGKIINFIFTDVKTEQAWIKATDIVATLVANFPDIGRFKWRRVRVMRALKDVLIGATDIEKLSKDLPLPEALEKNICRNCYRDADNFIDKAHKLQYLADGICDRCREELTIGKQF